MEANALPRTLQSITSTKIKELSKQRDLFESRKSAILEAAANQAQSPQDRFRALLEGVTRLKGFPNDGLDLLDEEEVLTVHESESSLWTRSELRNIRRFLLQSKYDASLSGQILTDWEDRLKGELDLLSAKHEHALFFSRLVTEWLAHSNEATPELPDDANMDGSFEPVGREEMHQQRAQWESLVFEPLETDPAAIEGYLDSLFKRTELSTKALEDLRKAIKKISTAALNDSNHFTVDSLKWIINGVIGSGLFSGEKLTTLKEILMNEAIAQEVGDVLNMRFAQLDTWSWSPEGVPVEMRRQLNGKYRVYMDEDILDALFVHYIGIKWSIGFSNAFKMFFKSYAWKSNSPTIPKLDLERRQYFLFENSIPTREGIDARRKDTFEQSYFMSQLASNEHGSMPDYSEDSGRTGPLDLKHSLLHLLITEARLGTALHGQTTVIRSDFKWFGPSLPHSTILTVLKFFGMPKMWLDFFDRFLQMPMKFVHDGPDAQARVRRRGVPISHAISECLGEVLLFSMDFSVNQHAGGAFLYRLHDDFWFWGQEKTCVEAWKAMTEFAKVMGIEFNEEKTGTARLGKESRVPGAGSTLDGGEILPRGDIRWGFLKLDEVTGRFVIDQEQVDVHIKELKRQLATRNSIFSWVQAWNSYFGSFFGNNFGKPARCFGREHIEMVITTLQRIEHELFTSMANENSKDKIPRNVTDYLRGVIAQRFDVQNLPEGFFYFPVELGGLQLRNPFIPFLAMRENMKVTPEKIIRDAFIREHKEYASAKENFEQDGPSPLTSTHRFNRLKTDDYSTGRPSSSFDAADNNNNTTDFMSLEEFTRYRELTSYPFRTAYRKLLEQPEELAVDRTPEVQSAQAKLAAAAAARGGRDDIPISSDWDSMSSYWKWVAELYRGGMARKFGGLAAVERGVVPLGVVKVLKEGKVKWQG